MRRKISSGSDIRPVPDSPSASSPSSGPISSTSLSARVRTFACVAAMRPHAVVHRRRDEHRPAVRERGLGEDVVGDPLRELGERVRRAGRDDEQVGVLEVRIQVLARRPPRERVERLRRDELLGAARDERHDVVPRLDEQPRQLAGLVGGDASGYAEQDPRHGRILPVRRAPPCYPGVLGRGAV